MTTGHAFEVEGYALAGDRLYDPDTHLWVQPLSDGRARVGFDPLGRETSGDIVAVSLAAPGTRLTRGAELGSIEAAKFVGPLPSPLTGTVVACNDRVLAAPGLLNDDPMEHWLAEIDAEEPGELAAMLRDQGEVREWFAAEVARFRAQGAIAE